MPSPGQLDDILALAAALDRGDLAEEALPARAAALPALDRAALDHLAGASEQAALSRPRLGWAIAAVGAAVPQPDPFLRALSQWVLARAANDWARPRRVEAAGAAARQGFAALGETGWAAACDWQLYALPWARNDLNRAVAALSQALEVLERAGMDRFAPACRAALAFAQILTGDSTSAEANLALCEPVFQARGDRLGEARAWVTRSGLLRRQGDYPQAYTYLNRAAETFEALGAAADRAKVRLSLGFCDLWWNGQHQAAEAHFLAAAQTFTACDLPLWEAQCRGGLSQVYNETGQLHAARTALLKARAIYTEYNVLGLVADSLLDGGRLELFWGNPTACLEALAKAEDLYASLGSTRMQAIAGMYRGWAAAQFARYQQALHSLEKAEAYFQAHQQPERLAECETHLAQVWTQLGRPDQAHACLSLAIQYFREAGQQGLLTPAYLRQANAFYQEGKTGAALTAVQLALSIAEILEDRIQAAFAHRAYGELLLALRRPEEALEHLTGAAREFEEMGMPSGQAACLAALGEYYTQSARPDAARKAWNRALHLSRDVAPEVSCRALDGLAGLAERSGDPLAALEAYRKIMANLVKIRRDFLQPALAGSYLRRQIRALDRAIALAAQQDAPEDALRFIEEGKAQTLLPQLAQGETGRTRADYSALEDLAAEIRWLSDRLRLTAGVGSLLSSDRAALARQLKEKNQQLDAALSRLERKRFTLAGGSSTASGAVMVLDGDAGRFDAAQFRRLARAHLGENWLALDYYLAESELVGLALTVDSLDVWSSPLTPRVQIAMEACAAACRSGQPPSENDRAVLGAFLLPLWLQKQLAPATWLVIAPHGRLHSLPWAALRLQEPARYWVEACIPVVVPSLYSLNLLWARAGARQPARQSGLILAVSEFQGRRQAIPSARVEARALLDLHGAAVTPMLDEAGTWKNLADAANSRDPEPAAANTGLSRFGFWHIASHAFHDSVTGRLSGVALYDGDLWLDRLWELAPLPGLVTLSACSGLQHVRFAGDEPTGLPVTCLAAGAQQVVGSLWPVPDAAVGRLMLDFYESWWAGHPPARALALAQRAALRREDGGPAAWAGFLCTGAPTP